MIPFDSGVLGNGEFEGKSRTAVESIAAAKQSTVGPNLAQDVLGQSASSLMSRLQDAKPDLTATKVERPTPACD